jgi:XRE family aerobic/anaerobic benzoate catabolism transcriptional regulator
MQFLEAFGKRVLEIRHQKKLSREQLAKKSGLSSRFLADIEGGKGNLSLLKLTDLCKALEVSPSLLLASLSSVNSMDSIFSMIVQCDSGQLKELELWLKKRLNRRHEMIALIGLRGAGKTTIGKKLARRLKFRFVELDERIEKAAGLTLQNIFEVHGEEYYRQLERDVLMDLILQERRTVLATGGGIVTRNETYDLLQQNCYTIWLKAKPEDHWNRVLQQDPRPMTNQPDAFAQLQNILQRREPLYARADSTINTSLTGIQNSVKTIAATIAG